MKSLERTQDYSEPVHPSAQQLNAFALGQLDEDASAEVERHLADCQVCGKLLETSPDDSFVAMFQEAYSSATFAGAAAPVSPSRPTRFVRGYQLLEVLGEGGMGVIWKARQEGLDRFVALKRIRSTGQPSAESLARFRREAEAIARLQHANIVQIYDVGEQDGEPYLALEYVEGGSLAQKLAAGPLLPRQAAELIETLARAMHHAHEHGIIHRDLKPGNILLASGGRKPPVPGAGTGGLRPPLAEYVPKISDFGLAKRLDEASAQTHTGAILGTPSYMAPEQAASEKANVGPLTDVYALGAILYETLTGRPPFRGPTVLDTLDQVREREPVPPRQLQPTVPRDLQTICLKCLQKEPPRRYGSALELADDLRRFAAGEPIRARPVGRLERLFKWIRRKPYQAMLAVILCLIPLGAIAALLWHSDRLQKEKNRAQTAEQNAQDNYAQARQTLGSILDRFGKWSKVNNSKNAASLQEGIVQDALTYAEKILNESEKKNDSHVREDVARLFLQIGQIQAYYGNPEEARVNFSKALTLWEQLSREQPKVLFYCSRVVNCYRSLAFLGGVAAEQQIEWLEKAIQIAEKSCRLEPDDELGLPVDLAQCHSALAAILLQRQHLAEAESHFQQANDLFARAVERHPEYSPCKLGLAGCCINLGLVYGGTRRIELAESAFRRADSLLETLMSDGEEGFAVAASRAGMALNWGNLYLEREQIDKALALYDRGIVWCEAVLRKEAKYSPIRGPAWKLHGTKAQTYDSLKRYPEAAAEWKHAIEYAEGPMRLQLRMWRSISLVRGGDSAHAAAEADALAAEPAVSSDVLYNCASVLALSGRGDKAIALLSKLRGNGYFKDAEHLKQLRADPNFDSLRKRDDFIRLLNDVTKPVPLK